MATSDNKVKFTNQFLNSKKIEVKVQGERETWWDKKVDGLGIRVSYTGRKSFFMMYRVDGTVRRLTIGKFPDLSLHDARDRAREIHRTTAGKIERAQTGASLQTIEKLAEVLEVHPMEFFRSYEAEDTKELGE